MAELVFDDLTKCAASLAVTVRVLTPVLNVTLKFCVPETSAAFEGNTAFGSEEVIATVSLTLVTRFQLPSTAFTKTVKGVPAVWAVGVPVLPVAVRGTADSPGARICNFVK